MLRALIRDHRALTLLLLACALAAKALIPQGYMAGGGTKLLSVQLCLDGITRKRVTVSIPVPVKGDPAPQKAPANEPCAFTALGMGALSGADAPLLALALIFILAAGFTPRALMVRGRTPYLRPPLRGPPLTA